MNLLIQHEYYQEVLVGTQDRREVEMDAGGEDVQAEKICSDEDPGKTGIVYCVC